MPTMPGKHIEWRRGSLFPLQRAFSRLVFGDLEEGLIAAAGAGDTPRVKKWLDRGADINVAGERALKSAALKGHNNTVALLLYLGVDPANLPPGSLPKSEYTLNPSPKRRHLAA